MNIFTSLEESKRLKDAGFPQGNPKETVTEWIHYVNGENGERYRQVTAAEIMEEMRKIPQGRQDVMDVVEWWSRHKSRNLIAALVEAYITMTQWKK